MITELPSNFLQSTAWAKTNKLIGHKVIKHNFGPAPTYMIVKSAKRGRYLEIPGGPLLDWQDPAAVSAAFAQIKKIAKAEKCVFARLRPQLLKSPDALALLADSGAVPAPMHLHAEHTILIDLTKSKPDLLAAMRRQTRYEVRRAAKLGIKIKKTNTEQAFKAFHAAQSETAARQHFIPPDLKTLLAERKAFGKNAQIYIAYAPVESEGTPPPEGGESATSPTSGSIFLRENTIGRPPVTTGGPTGARSGEVADSPARSDSIAPHSAPAEESVCAGFDRSDAAAPVAYALVLSEGSEAAYFEAASTDLNRKLPGAYALQWQIIQDLKSQGITRYNLWGIAPPGAKNHRYSGVTTFKTGFGGEIIEFVPAHDLIISKSRYQIDRAIETLRKKRRNL